MQLRTAATLNGADLGRDILIERGRGSVRGELIGVTHTFGDAVIGARPRVVLTVRIGVSDQIEIAVPPNLTVTLDLEVKA